MCPLNSKYEMSKVPLTYFKQNKQSWAFIFTYLHSSFSKSTQHYFEITTVTSKKSQQLIPSARKLFLEKHFH